ncbi:MAG: ion transporter [Nannocystaceae bacterium]|nr:ion transporter [bacterium]
MSETSPPECEPSKPSVPEARERLAVVIFGTATPAGRAFDVALLLLIVASVLAVVLESVEAIGTRFRLALRVLDWVFTILFLAEYVVRIWVARDRLRYVFSFFGIVDLLSILPSFIGIFISGAHSLLVIRVLRLLRVFRVLKVVRMLGEANQLLSALRASFAKITVFMGAVLTVVVVMGATMHLIEGAENGFTSIPRGMYWAIVTMTTVGYGDIAPATVLGQAIAALLMLLGYGILAVPTGIVSAEYVQAARSDGPAPVECQECGAKGHPTDANFCRVCGTELV